MSWARTQKNIKELCVYFSRVYLTTYHADILITLMKWLQNIFLDSLHVKTHHIIYIIVAPFIQY